VCVCVCVSIILYIHARFGTYTHGRQHSLNQAHVRSAVYMTIHIHTYIAAGIFRAFTSEGKANRFSYICAYMHTYKNTHMHFGRDI
jgi:hypothetical protein